MESNGKHQADKFLIEIGPGATRTLVVVGKWSTEAEEALSSGQADGLELNYARGFNESSLDFLHPLPVRRLLVLDRGLDALEPVLRLAPTLEELRLDTNSSAQVDLEKLPRLRVIAADWRQVQHSFQACTSLRAVTLGNYDEQDLKALSLGQIEELELHEPTRLTSLRGLNELHSLLALRVFDGRLLRDITELSEIPGAKEIELQDCPLVDSLVPAQSLTRLEFLNISDCGEIESLEPLEGLHRLETFHAWGSTRIVNGDLRPLQRLKHLKEIRMRDRPEYTPTLVDVIRQMASRS